MKKRKYNLGGVKMKKKLLIVILFCFGIAGMASAAEVINIDLNGYNDANVYTGTAAYNDGINKWNTYFGGWGKPMGSPRSANLANYNEPCVPGIYAAAVWIGENAGTNRLYVYGTGLMDDGFKNNPNVPGDPNIQLFGQGGYGGTYDIYVYGASAGTFTLTRGSTVLGANSVDGTAPSGQFVLGKNYVVFQNVNIANDPNFVRIKYSNVINGLQLVKKKQPVAIKNGTEIGARDYDVAFDTNRRSGESQLFGPDIGGADAWSTYGYVGYLDYYNGGEYMEYDVTMDDVNEGEYNIYALVDTRSVDAINMDISFNGLMLGTVQAAYTGEPDLSMTNPVSVNIFGSPEVQTFKWQLSAAAYHNIAYFLFERIGNLNMPDCNAVYRYGFNYAGDLNGDCKVNYKDLDLISEQWLSCYDPNENNCP
jgi:hypothetical protein